MTAHPPALEPGDRLGGRYEILAAIGSGGMGTVYEVRHEVLARRAAAKVLRPELASRDRHVARFVREARAAAAVGDPRVVEVFDFGRTDSGLPWFVMELCEGVSAGALVRRGPLPWEQASAIAIEVCEAMEAVHAAGIVHRDLKPDNLMVEREPRSGRIDVKILDFGVAKLRDGGAPGLKPLTICGTVCGTPEYMSPEQCRGADVDTRSDIYSLGCVLWELLVGHAPLARETPLATITAQVMDRPVAPSTFVANLPEGVDRIVMRALSKRPEDRFPSMRAFARAIRDVAIGRRRFSTPTSYRRGPRTAPLPHDLATLRLTPQAPPPGVA